MFLYSTVPRRSACGSLRRDAASPAARIASAEGFCPTSSRSASSTRRAHGPAAESAMPAARIVPSAPSVTCTAAAAVAKSPTLRSTF